jgi:hypothetical protein
MNHERGDLRLVPTDAFDARQGYIRWASPGIGTRTTKRGSLAQADLWVDRRGDLYTRFTSLGYTLHFRIKRTSSATVTPDMKDAVEAFLHRMLITWVVDGVADDLECDEIEYEEPDTEEHR